MKTVAALLAVVAVALAVAGGSIVLGDRQTMVPPPDAAAEAFARALVERRYDVAVQDLSSARRREVGREGLRQWFEAVRQQLGPPNQVDASLEWISGDAAAARVSIDARLAAAVLHMRLVREHGIWTIDALPSDVAIVRREPANR